MASLVTVAIFNHRIESGHHVVTGDAPHEGPAVINPARGISWLPDWGLAAVLGKGAAALSPTGRVYQKETIDFLLEERNMKAKYRRGGGRTRGPKKRTTADDHRFEQNLYRLLQSLQT